MIFLFLVGCGDDEKQDCAEQWWYPDSDGDGLGSSDGGVYACEPPLGAVSEDRDCDDSDAGVYSGAPEVCDEKDNDCDGSIDEGVVSVFYEDSDDDGYGNSEGASVEGCSAPSGYAPGGDCDDTSADVSPDEAEICGSNIDEDCDGLVSCEDGDCMADCIEDCEDGTDNDEDGLVDCEDDDCMVALVCGSVVVQRWGGTYRVSFDSKRFTPLDRLTATIVADSMSGVVQTVSDSGAVLNSCSWSLQETRFEVSSSANTFWIGSLDAPTRSGFTIDSGCRFSDSEFLSSWENNAFILGSPHGRIWLPMFWTGWNGNSSARHTRYSGVLQSSSSNNFTSSRSGWRHYSLSSLSFEIP